MHWGRRSSSQIAIFYNKGSSHQSISCWRYDWSCGSRIILALSCCGYGSSSCCFNELPWRYRKWLNGRQTLCFRSLSHELRRCNHCQNSLFEFNSKYCPLHCRYLQRANELSCSILREVLKSFDTMELSRIISNAYLHQPILEIQGFYQLSGLLAEDLSRISPLWVNSNGQQDVQHRLDMKSSYHRAN